MTAPSLERRRELAWRIRGARDRIAEDVTRDFLERHPDWVQRYGERARRHGIEDARFHLDFLASAVEAGSPRAFADYAAWTAGMLAARGIAPTFVAETLEQLEAALAGSVAGEEAALLAACLAAARAACAGAPAPPGVDASRSPFLQAVLGGHRLAAANIALELLRAGRTVVDVYADLLQDAMYEVGRLWESGAITVAQEHMATATVQHVMAQLYPHLPRPAERRGRAVIAGVQGELHQIGAMMVADALEGDGWEVRFFGADVPHAAVLAALAERQADVLGISATTLLSLPRVADLFAAVRARAAPPPALVLGGALVRACPELCQDLGAVAASSDLRQSVARLRALAPR